MQRGHIGWLAVIVSTGALACATPAAAGTPPRPDPIAQAPRDGCLRSPTPFVTETETGIVQQPEWVYVYRDRTPRVVEGAAHVTRVPEMPWRRTSGST